MIVVGGEITTNTYVDIPKLARGVVDDIGYTRAKYGFDGETCAVLTAIDEQSLRHRPGRRHRLRGAAHPRATTTRSTRRARATRA